MPATSPAPTAKQRIAKAVASLPDDATFEDAMERIAFLRKIEQGLAESRQGLSVPQAEVEAEATAWRR